MYDIRLETECRVEKSLLILFGCDDIREPDNNLLVFIKRSYGTSRNQVRFSRMNRKKFDLDIA
jgi:hypothetical protein